MYVLFNFTYKTQIIEKVFKNGISWLDINTFYVIII